VAARLTLVPRAEQPLVPWRNGLGRTREVARAGVAGEAAGERFDWRVSLALVDRSCPFSAFPGVDRTILLVEGEGFALDFGGAAPPRRVDRPLEPVAFAGEWATTCTLLGGPTEDLNVMVDRARARGRVAVLRGPHARMIDGDEAVAVALLGEVRLTLDAEGVTLGPGDALRVSDARAVALAVDPAAGAALVLATFEPR
jgi:environmental stress-induced protein Ves